MKSFAVAYGMARRAQGLKPVGPVEELPAEEDMIAAIQRRKLEKLETPMELEDAESLEEPDPKAAMRDRIAKILGR